MMSEVQAEIKQEASQSGCSACKKGLGSRAETRLREGQEGRARVPSQPPCHAPPALPPHRHTLVFGVISFPSLKPVCLCLQQLPSISVREPFPKKGPETSAPVRQSRGMQTNSLCHAWGCCSEPHLSSTNNTGMPSLPSAGQGTSSPPLLAGVNQVWPLPTASRSPGKRHAAYPKAKREPGDSPRAEFPPGACIKLS